MKVKIEVLKQILDRYPNDLVVDANINLNIVEIACDPGEDTTDEEDIWGNDGALEPDNPWRGNNSPEIPLYKTWIHPIFKELNYSDNDAISITDRIIEGMKACKDKSMTRNLPTGIISYCSGFNRRLSAYYHDYNKADRVINEIIDNNKQLWN